MATGDPSRNMAAPAPTGGKGKKKKPKMVKLTLDQFLATPDGKSNRQPAAVSTNWATMTEDIDAEAELGSYKFDRSKLPSAPKAALGPSNVDLSMIPEKGPYSAYVGNLNYETKESDLEDFFSELEIDTVRIINDMGRPKGYAYVDFLTKESLIEALSYHEKEYMGRNLRVDLASQRDGDQRAGGGGFDRNAPMRSEEAGSDWMKRDPPSGSSGSSFGGSRGGDRDGGFRGGDRDGGFNRDRRDGGRDGDRGRDEGRGYGFSGRSEGAPEGNDKWERGPSTASRGGSSGGGGGAWERGSGAPASDRSERGTWERGDRSAPTPDRSYGGDRDNRGGADGGGTWERGSTTTTTNSFGGDRDRGYGGDRDRGFGGDRDRGFGGDRDRGYNDRGYDRGNSDRDRGYDRGGDRGGYGGDRDGGYRNQDRYGDRDGRSRGYGSRDDGGRYGGSRDGGYSDRRMATDVRKDEGYERKPVSRDGSGERKEPAATAGERPKLQLKARTKPAEEKKLENKENSQPAARPSIFGSAKPVDTYAREKQIEEKLNSMPVRPRREEAGDAAPVSRQNSNASHNSTEENMEPLRSPTVKTSPEAPKLVAAPTPKENPWGKKPVIADSTNNASSASAPVSPPTQAPATRAPEARQPRDIPAPAPKTSAWGKGPAAAPARSDKPREPGYGKGKQEPQKKKEKHIPTHYDEMPKYEGNKALNIADGNKFAFLVADGYDEEEQES